MGVMSQVATDGRRLGQSQLASSAETVDEPADEQEVLALGLNVKPRSEPDVARVLPRS